MMTEQIPTTDTLPVLGSALNIRQDPFGFIEEAVETHEPVFRVSIPGLSFVCYADAELVKRVLVDQADRYRKDPREINRLGQLLGDGLLTARGETWERGREHVQPAFYPGRLAEYATKIRRHARAAVSEWADGERINIHQEATRLTLSIIASTIFGVDEAVETEVIADAAEAITNRFESSTVPVDVPLWVPTPANRRYKHATDELDEMIEELLHRRRTQSTLEEDDLCSALLVAGESETLSDEEIRDHLVTLLFAGHETTAITLTYALGLLATHPNEQQHIRTEVREADSLSLRSELPSTERTIRETLRLYPPAFMLHRETTEPDVVAGYEIPKGTRVVLPQWGLHRSPRYYDAPTEFHPDRWTNKMQEALPEFAYFPFGGGKRQCIGRQFALLELKLVLAEILRAIRVDTTPETDFTPKPALTARPTGPVWLRVKRGSR